MAEELSGSPEAQPTAPVAGSTSPSPESNTSPTAPDPALGTKGSEEWEKRFKGIQSDLANERKARQQYAQQLAAQETRYKAELDAERRRVQALAGVNPKSPEEAEADEIRTRLAQVATPEWLLKQLGLTQEQLDAVKASQENQGRVADVERHVWAKHGEMMRDRVVGIVAKEYGDLTPRQIDRITESYVLRAQRDPEFLERHEAGDETLAAEFAKELLEDWYEPAKRRVTTTEVGRFRPVPNGQSRGIVTHGEKKINVSSDKEVEDLLVAGFRERGGQFGRR